MRTERFRSWVAWATSALLHGLLTAVVLWSGATALRAPIMSMETTVELDLEVREHRGSGDERPVNLGAPPPPAAHRSVKGSRAAGSPSPASSPSPTSAPAPANAPAAVGRATRIDLSFQALPAEVKKTFGAPLAGEAVLQARSGRFSVDELRADLERRRDAVANVEAGRVDPLLYDYLRGARARFQQNAERLAQDLAVGGGDALRGWAHGYLRTVEDVNRGAIGARQDAGHVGPNDQRTEKSPGADVLGAYDEARRQADAGAEVRRTEICLDIDVGRETTAVLRRSSGNASLDRLTVESFTKSVAARPVPPDARRGKACYELEISAHRMPPMPFVSCGIGESGLTCVWPFKKITSVKGRLVSVEYPSPAGTPGRGGPSLLQKPR